MKHHQFILPLSLLAGCAPSSGSPPSMPPERAKEKAKTFTVDVWADNWFAMYLEDSLVGEDSVPITTERSFNSETFSFDADYPLHINVVVKDYKQNDTGLEYIGTPRQQMGDGGFIAQITDNRLGRVVGGTDAAWRCLVIHEAPLDKSCEASRDPSARCDSSTRPEPVGWKSADFDTTDWPVATEYEERQVRPKDGYDRIAWDERARLIWTADLETHNTLLCKAVIDAP
ncbi:MAG: PEBP family protein [Myxococcota bacterium]